MKLDLNLEGHEVKEGFDVAPSGEYDVRVLKVEKRTGPKASYLYWELEIVNEPDWSGTKIFHNTSLSDKALQMPTGIVAFWKALDLPLNDIDTTEPVGLELTIDVGQETFRRGNGEEVLKNSVERVHFQD